MTDTQALLKPLKLKHLTLRNRIMSTSHAPGYAEDGMPMDKYQLYHAEKAKGGIALTCFGVALATRIRSLQAFMAIMQMVLLPMFFASGALYPLRGLPGWLEVLTRLDPLTYAVAPLRHAVLRASGQEMMAKGVTWGGFAVPIWLDLVVIGGAALLVLLGSLPRFSRTDA